MDTCELTTFVIVARARSAIMRWGEGLALLRNERIDVDQAFTSPPPVAALVITKPP